MSSLSTVDKQVLEKLFQMSTGYVLNFNDRSFAGFFKDNLHVNIYAEEFKHTGASKANCMRSFWQVADDAAVGRCIKQLIKYIDIEILLGALRKTGFPDELIQRGQVIAERLLGAASEKLVPSENEFIARQFGTVSIEKLDLGPVMNQLLTQRMDEIRVCLSHSAPLAAIFLCGSSLEGILLGIATKRAKDFNQSNQSPKDKTGKVKQFHEWTLNDFINVARDLRLLGEDVKQFSHALREFRNYIHPFQQMSSNFNPNQHTALICWQVLQAAVTDLGQY